MGSQNPTMASDVDGLTQGAGSALNLESKNPAQTIEEDGLENASPAPALKRVQTTCGIPSVKKHKHPRTSHRFSTETPPSPPFKRMTIFLKLLKQSGGRARVGNQHRSEMSVLCQQGKQQCPNVAQKKRLPGRVGGTSQNDARDRAIIAGKYINLKTVSSAQYKQGSLRRHPA